MFNRRGWGNNIKKFPSFLPKLSDLLAYLVLNFPWKWSIFKNEFQFFKKSIYWIVKSFFWEIQTHFKKLTKYVFSNVLCSMMREYKKVSVLVLFFCNLVISTSALIWISVSARKRLWGRQTYIWFLCPLNPKWSTLLFCSIIVDLN